MTVIRRALGVGARTPRLRSQASGCPGRPFLEHQVTLVVAKLSLICWLAAELLLAIENEEITLAFQPELALEIGHIVGVEALARWRRPSEPAATG